MATTFRIDGRTGFDRLWILISVLWIGLWGVFAGRAADEQAPDIEHLRLADINGPTGLRLDYTILSDEELLGLASAVKANDETPMARTALATVPLRRAVCGSPEAVRTKNVPRIEAMIPTADRSRARDTPYSCLSGGRVAAAMIMPETIAPT